MEMVRIAKLMALRGLCSRREAESLIEKGWVQADGEKIIECKTRVSPDAVIELDDQAEQILLKQATVLLNKPVGLVSSQPEKGYTAAVSLITPENQWKSSGNADSMQIGPLKGLAPAGRLDIDSQGLLVLTQDGRIARSLIGSDSKVDKEYLVRFQGDLDEKKLALLNHGLILDGRPLKPAQVVLLYPNELKFILWEGRNRQIRRMCALVGIEVLRLKRVRIGRIVLGNLPYGKWRFLREEETF
jgi:23S rRNA pseudouridine2604 synthase